MTNVKNSSAAPLVGVWMLFDGPAREPLFDSLRLGGSIKEFPPLIFSAKRTTPEVEYRVIMSVNIEGLHRAGNPDVNVGLGCQAFFFWGRAQEIRFGTNRGSIPNRPCNGICTHVFGRWDCSRRYGSVVFRVGSAFENPLALSILADSKSILSTPIPDHWAANQLFEVCKKHWTSELIHKVCVKLGPEFPTDLGYATWNMFMATVPWDARIPFVIEYLDELIQQSTGTAGCKCVLAEGEERPCEHDMAMLLT